MSENTIYIEGAISIQAVLNARSRPIHELIISHERRDHDALMLERAATRAGATVRRAAPEAIDALAHGSTHGGVLARAGERGLLSLAALAQRNLGWVTMLDGVEDPFNFGQAVRALYAAGCDALVVRERNWMSAAGTVIRASAGASELIATAVAESPEEAAKFFKALNLKIVATSGEREARSLYKCDLNAPMFLMIGGERRGISRQALQLVDWTVRIPYGRDFRQSLGTTGATAVLAFEIMRQRRMEPSPNPQMPDHASRGFAQRSHRRGNAHAQD